MNFRWCMVIMLALATLTISQAFTEQPHTVQDSAVFYYPTQLNDSTATEFDQFAASTSERGARFSHPQQLTIVYLLVAFLTAFKCFFRYFQQVPNRDPWYRIRRDKRASRRLSGWKESNLLYKAKLTYHS